MFAWENMKICCLPWGILGQVAVKQLFILYLWGTDLNDQKSSVIIVVFGARECFLWKKSKTICHRDCAAFLRVAFFTCAHVHAS